MHLYVNSCSFYCCTLSLQPSSVQLILTMFCERRWTWTLKHHLIPLDWKRDTKYHMVSAVHLGSCKYGVPMNCHSLTSLPRVTEAIKLLQCHIVYDRGHIVAYPHSESRLVCDYPSYMLAQVRHWTSMKFCVGQTMDVCTDWLGKRVRRELW